jgi:hypothetical protein
MQGVSYNRITTILTNSSLYSLCSHSSSDEPHETPNTKRDFDYEYVNTEEKQS